MLETQRTRLVETDSSELVLDLGDDRLVHLDGGTHYSTLEDQDRLRLYRDHGRLMAFDRIEGLSFQVLPN